MTTLQTIGPLAFVGYVACIVLASTGGLKKFRMSDPSRSKGKRGGPRIIYLDLPDREVTYLLYLYSKDEAEDLTQADKKALKSLVNLIKEEKNEK